MRKILSLLFLLFLFAGSFTVYAAFCKDSDGNRFCGGSCASSGGNCTCTGACSAEELEAVLN